MQTMLHTHWESRFDAVPKIKAMFNRLKEIGIKSVAVTDHGSLCAIQDVLDYNNMLPEEDQLNIIYGVEAYLAYRGQIEKPAHFIIMAKDDIGKMCIDKIIYDANTNINSKDMPVISEDMLEKHFGKGMEGYGHAVFTTACVAGVPSLELLENSNAHRVIERIQKRAAKAIEDGKAIAPTDTSYGAKIQIVIDSAKNEMEELRNKREVLKKVASKKTGMLEKKLQKAIDFGDSDSAVSLENEIKSVKNNAVSAEKELEQIAIKLKVLQRNISEESYKLKEYNGKVEKYNEFATEIAEQKARLKDDSVLYAQAVESVENLIRIVGKENLYIELQYHGLENERYVYPLLAKIAKELNLPVVAANDAHMADNSEDSLNARRISKFLRFGNIPDSDREGTESYNADKELYLKSGEELASALRKILPENIVMDAIANADKIGEICKYKQVIHEHYPVYQKGVDAKKLIRELAQKGVEWRFPNKADFTEVYQKRLEKELKIICDMGYADYHLIMKEVLEYARILGNVPPEHVNEVPLDIEEAKKYVEDHGWDVGIGIGHARGSAAGSLVCYVLGITGIDPIKYDLLFERFLNPERVTMPDIDSDFRTDIRDHTVEFVIKKYGASAVCKILTKNYQGVKGAIRDAARYYGALKQNDDKYYLSLGTEIRKNVPVFLNITFAMHMSDISKSYKNSDLTVYEYMCNCFSENKDALEILKLAKSAEGSFVSYGAHAAGVVISDNDDVTDYVPLRYNDSLKLWETQITKEQVESNGLLKMDFLNLKNLDIISDTLRLIKHNYDLRIDVTKLPFEKEVFEKIFAVGMTTGVFQFESPGMKKYLKKLKPSCIDDLILLNAMYRPGPEQFLDSVCDVKNGVKKVSYVTKELEPILKDTYGAIVYQEQVMEICQKLAGYSLGRADMVRRYMSKKKESKLLKERKAFIYGEEESGIAGCLKNGILEDAANRIFDQMIDFAKYAFNKSHAAAYTVLAYATGWLKYHYPAEYLCSLLNHKDKVEDYIGILNDARELGVEICLPDINLSGVDFSVVDGKILFGLSSLKGIGLSCAGEIIKERKEGGSYKSFKDYMVRKGSSAKDLIDAGCFDEFGYSRASLQGPWYSEINALAGKIRDKKNVVRNGERVLNILTDRHYESLEDLKSDLKQNGISYSINGKKVPTSTSVENRINNAKLAIDDLQNELDTVEIWNIPDDVEKKLMAEQSVLGVFLTGHPIDKYEVKTPCISNITDQNKELSGVIVDLDEKLDKNGNKYAFVTLSDRSGEMKCIVFAKAYKKFSSDIRIGNGIMINGKVSVDDFNSDEENGDIVYTAIANDIRSLREKKDTFCLEVPNEVDFFFGIEDEMEKHYDSNGVKVVIYTMNTPRYWNVKKLVNRDWITQKGAYILK